MWRFARERELSQGKKARVRGIFEQPIAKTLAVTIGINRIATNHSGVNPYGIRNQVLVE